MYFNLRLKNAHQKVDISRTVKEINTLILSHVKKNCYDVIRDR